MTDAYLHASAMQRLAASPCKSVFVSANAGSGKTRVLVQRVSRLLLAGTPPDKILCLTYTKAAATEMQARLFKALGDWSIMGADDLTKALDELEESPRARSEQDLGQARQLFARALETPGGLKVQTIHAFCEKLLRRFPLEAGLPLGVEAIDDADARALRQQVWIEIETLAMADPSGALAGAISLLAAQKYDDALEDLYGWAMKNTYKVDAWQAAGGADNLAKNLGLAPGDTAENIMARAWQDAPKTQIKTAADEMMGGGTTDITKAGYIYKALVASDDIAAYKTYQKMFFTKAGAPNVSMVTAKAGVAALALFGDKKAGIQAEASRVVATEERVRKAHMLTLTRAAYDISVLAAENYRALKTARRVMDFDDQIYKARALLVSGDARDWVRYKLDGGVDHILLDEAQDTSGAQWDIVDALSEEFFQPAPDRDPRKPRTLFAVGDEKQSIYSFQGAEPELFLGKVQKLTEKQADTPQVNMAMSFRSAHEILGLVDYIFYKQGGILETFDADIFAPASDKGGHDAFRSDSGLAEFWPIALAPEAAGEETAWKPEPVNALSQGSAREQLARAIAVQIKEWLAGGEAVFDRDAKEDAPKLRAMRPGDIMILVRKRSDFFEAVIRNLKEQGVPVAGADTLNLSESVAVQDLISLAKFILLPSDDLSLAEVLKSPVFGWDDDALYNIAAGRKGSLWQAVPSGETRSVLKDMMSRARRAAPYEFFAGILSFVMKDGRSVLQRFFDRLGLEAADALDAFLARALAHQRRSAPSLTHFIAALESSEATLKREMDAGQNEVRVMTVHAAKGLEAPVVILPDTTQKPTASKAPLLAAGAGFVMDVRAAQRPKMLTDLIEAQSLAAMRESMRLLYVALTRAESRLLVCGFQSGRSKNAAPGSWHDRVSRALADMEGAQEYETPFGKGRRFGVSPGSAAAQAAVAVKIENLPVWARTLAPAYKPDMRRYSPSRLADADESVPVRSPLHIAAAPDRFLRGNLIHKLLEILPAADSDKRRALAQTYLDAQQLSAAETGEIISEVFAVLEHPDYAQFFADGSRAEVSLAGRASALPKGAVFNGQIDRLCVGENDVWILDYKSNRPPPEDIKGVAPLYVRQMAAYRALTRELYPSETVHCGLLWTHAPRLMVIPDALMDAVNWDAMLGA